MSVILNASRIDDVECFYARMSLVPKCGCLKATTSVSKRPRKERRNDTSGSNMFE